MDKKKIAGTFFGMGLMFTSTFDSLFEGNLKIGFVKLIILIILFSVSYKFVFE